MRAQPRRAAGFGILVCLAAIALGTALGAGGGDHRAAGQIRALRATAIFVTRRSNVGAPNARPRTEGDALNEADGRAIVRESSSVVSVVPFLSAEVRAATEDRTADSIVVGTTPGYLDVLGFTVASGAMFGEADERTRAKVCVLGETARKALFGAQDGVGEIVRIGRHPFRVLGILSKSRHLPPFGDQDDRLIVPATTFRTWVLPTPEEGVDMLIASATDPRTVRRAEGQIASVLRRRHSGGDRERAFDIRSQTDLLTHQRSVFDAFRSLLVLGSRA